MKKICVLLAVLLLIALQMENLLKKKYLKIFGFNLQQVMQEAHWALHWQHIIFIKNNHEVYLKVGTPCQEAFLVPYIVKVTLRGV